MKNFSRCPCRYIARLISSREEQATTIQTSVVQDSTVHIGHVSPIVLSLEGMFSFPIILKISSKYKTYWFWISKSKWFYVTIIPWCTSCMVIMDNKSVCDGSSLLAFSTVVKRFWLFVGSARTGMLLYSPCPVNMNKHMKVASCPHSNYWKHLDTVSL